jgi:Fe-S-cluster-containing dehydrogenase component
VTKRPEHASPLHLHDMSCRTDISDIRLILFDPQQMYVSTRRSHLTCRVNVAAPEFDVMYRNTMKPMTKCHSCPPRGLQGGANAVVEVCFVASLAMADKDPNSVWPATPKSDLRKRFCHLITGNLTVRAPEMGKNIFI